MKRGNKLRFATRPVLIRINFLSDQGFRKASTFESVKTVPDLVADFAIFRGVPVLHPSATFVVSSKSTSRYQISAVKRALSGEALPYGRLVLSQKSRRFPPVNEITSVSTPNFP